MVIVNNNLNVKINEMTREKYVLNVIEIEFIKSLFLWQVVAKLSP